MGTTMDKSVSVDMLAEFAAAWNRHDIDALMSFMSEDCVFLTVAGPEQWGARHGPTPCAAFAAAWQNFPDAQWRNGRHWVCGEHGVSESTFTGTAADGSRVEADMVDVHLQERQDPGQERLPQAAPGLAAGARLEAAAAPIPQGAKHGRSHGCADECPHGRFDAGRAPPAL